jgi:hypothetical protein
MFGERYFSSYFYGPRYYGKGGIDSGEDLLGGGADKSLSRAEIRGLKAIYGKGIVLEPAPEVKPIVVPESVPEFEFELGQSELADFATKTFKQAQKDSILEWYAIPSKPVLGTDIGLILSMVKAHYNNNSLV